MAGFWMVAAHSAPPRKVLELLTGTDLNSTATKPIRSSNMNKFLATLLVSAALMSQASARAAPRHGVQECVGEIQVAVGGYYNVDDCTFDGKSKVGKQILSACGDPAKPPVAEDTSYFCTVKAWGEFAPDFYIKRVIKVSQTVGGELQ
jgi:hypothetical protein